MGRKKFAIDEPCILQFVQSALFHFVCPFRQYIMITECTLLLSSHYKKWLTVSVIHRLWSNKEFTNGGLAAIPTATATNFFCLELGHWNSLQFLYLYLSVSVRIVYSFVYFWHGIFILFNSIALFNSIIL